MLLHRPSEPANPPADKSSGDMAQSKGVSKVAMVSVTGARIDAALGTWNGKSDCLDELCEESSYMYAFACLTKFLQGISVYESDCLPLLIHIKYSFYISIIIYNYYNMYKCLSSLLERHIRWPEK